LRASRRPVFTPVFTPVITPVFGLAFGLALSVAGCSARTVQAVDPYPCADAGINGCPPGLLDDLVGFWRLNDGMGSARAHDSSGWSNDGALVDLMPSTAWTASGPEKTALTPQGRGYVEVSSSPSIAGITTQLSLVAWVLIEGPIEGDFATAISRQIGTGNGQHYHLSINAQQKPAFFVTTPASGQVVLFGSPVSRGTWVHLAGTYDGSTSRLYVDGEAVKSAPVVGTFAKESNPVILGGNANGDRKDVSELVVGSLNDVMLYRRALRPEEIARLHMGALLP